VKVSEFVELCDIAVKLPERSDLSDKAMRACPELLLSAMKAGREDEFKTLINCLERLIAIWPLGKNLPFDVAFPGHVAEYFRFLLDTGTNDQYSKILETYTSRVSRKHR